MHDTANSQPLRIDTHVHMHACFDEQRFLNAAADNLRVPSVPDGRISGLLCLTETSEANWFAQIDSKSRSGKLSNGTWRFEPTDEQNSCVAVDSQDRRIAIIAGKQIVTAEGLEVLALGLKDGFADGELLASILEAVDRANAVPIVPWGFGKWLGRRGKLVEQVITDPPCTMYLGDNGGRLAMLSEPRQFAEARALGMRVLPGTDPFPFSWDVDRVGSFGLEYHGIADSSRPFHSLRCLLSDPATELTAYGRPETLPRFIRNQIAIQVRKRAGKPGR